MAAIELKGLHSYTSKGRVYFYAWRGGPRIKADPSDPAAFAAEFAKHHADRQAPSQDRIAGLITRWKTSPIWVNEPQKGGYSAGTKKNWRGPLDRVQEEFGKLRISAFDDTKEARKRIKRWLRTMEDRPRTADMHKQVLSALLSYAVEEDELKQNPCFGISNVYSNDRADIIWTDDDLALMETVASPEVMWALKLGCLTGMRQGDLLRLAWSHIDELSIELGANKSRKRGRTTQSYVVPMYADLKAVLDTIPRRSTMVLTNGDGHPWKTGFSSSWNKAMKSFEAARVAKGLTEPTGLHFHDSRGTFATMAFSSQIFSVAEIAEMLAWAEDKVERIINRYVRRDALLRDKIKRMDEARQKRAEES